MSVASHNIVFCSQALLVVGLLSSALPGEGGKGCFQPLERSCKGCRHRCVGRDGNVRIELTGSLPDNRCAPMIFATVMPCDFEVLGEAPAMSDVFGSKPLKVDVGDGQDLNIQGWDHRTHSHLVLDNVNGSDFIMRWRHVLMGPPAAVQPVVCSMREDATWTRKRWLDANCKVLWVSDKCYIEQKRIKCLRFGGLRPIQR